MSSSSIHFRRSRGGFTLTELLIAITIIGLLVGMLAVAGTGVLSTARETAVITEMTQMSQAVESFKTKYGFYPPSFEQFQRQTTNSSSAAFVAAEANQLLPFLNKIAPGHRELDPSPTAAGFRRIDDWWQRVGVNLNEQTSLQFWLSGLCHNKQFPLTGGLMTDPYIPVGFNADLFVTGVEIPDGVIEREVLFDFDQARLVPQGDIGGTNNLPVATYIMDHGKTNGDLFYVYRDSESYVPPVFDGSGPLDRTNPDHPSMAYHFWDGSSAVTRNDFANPNTFQLISFGLDGDAGILNPETGVAFDFIGQDGVAEPQFRGVLNSQLPAAADNLCNFANGRLDKFIDDQQ